MASWRERNPKSYLAVLVVLLIVSRAVDQALYYRIVDAMDGYVWFFSAIVLPVAFLIVVWPIVIYKLWCTNHITPEMRAVPQKPFFILGIYDTLYNILSAFPVTFIGGSVSNILSQTVLPQNMGLSSLVLRTKYTKLHFLGAFLSVYGVVVRILPVLTDGGDSGGTATGAAFLFWSLFMVVAMLPSAMGNVFKEVELKGHDLDVWYMNACISAWQLLFGIITAPTIGIPGNPDYVPLNQLGTYIKDAAECFVGIDPTPAVNGTALLGAAPSGAACAADSMPAIGLFAIFLGFNIAYNLLALEVMKRGSSVLFVVASAVRLPLVDILLLFPFIAGPATQPFTAYDGMALVALLVGLWAYNADEELKSDQPPRTLADLCRLTAGWFAGLFGICRDLCTGSSTASEAAGHCMSACCCCCLSGPGADGLASDPEGYSAPPPAGEASPLIREGDHEGDGLVARLSMAEVRGGEAAGVRRYGAAQPTP